MTKRHNGQIMDPAYPLSDAAKTRGGPTKPRALSPLLLQVVREQLERVPRHELAVHVGRLHRAIDAMADAIDVGADKGPNDEW
ncbi:MAG: hypothetical protein ACOY3P_05830 [Planctomycetota bacterium]